LTTCPEAFGATWTKSVIVTTPPSGRSAVRSGDPVPDAVLQTPPLLPAHVHDWATTVVGTGSEMLTPSSRAGPALLTTIWYETTSPGFAVATLADF
jgi:hypothetical protein